MKRKYIKPSIMAISLTSNELLCSCLYDAVGPNMDPLVSDAISGMDFPFTKDSNCVDVVVGYCKHTPEGNTVFNS